MCKQNYNNNKLLRSKNYMNTNGVVTVSSVRILIAESIYWTKMCLQKKSAHRGAI